MHWCRAPQSLLLRLGLTVHSFISQRLLLIYTSLLYALLVARGCRHHRIVTIPHDTRAYKCWCRKRESAYRLFVIFVAMCSEVEGHMQNMQTRHPFLLCCFDPDDYAPSEAVFVTHLTSSAKASAEPSCIPHVLLRYWVFHPNLLVSKSVEI